MAELDDRLTAELSALYEIAALAAESTEHSVCRVATGKAIRLFSVRYFALLAAAGPQAQALALAGSDDVLAIRARAAEPAANRFTATLCHSDQPVLLFMEQAAPIGSRERRLFTIFARTLEQTLTTARSIAQRQQVEEELRKANFKLEERAQQLEAALKDLQLFSYIVSHDLRSPLRTISGYAENLVEDHAGQLGEQGLLLVQRIANRCERMQRLLADILVFSRVSRHEFKLNPIDMEEIVHEASDDFTVIGSDRLITFNVGPLPPAHGDPEMIRLVVANLLSNAIKFTQEREQSVIAVTGEPDGQMNRYTVTDNGIGFENQYAGKMFGAFERLHADLPYEGSGLGLSIVRQIIEKHGGSAWAEGLPGEGASFHFTLPAQRDMSDCPRAGEDSLDEKN